MIVMKFGGTSNQDARAMANVVQIIQSHQSRRPFVVISAIAQATNVLERAGKLAAAGRPTEAQSDLRKLFDRHRAILDDLIRDPNRQANLRSTIDQYSQELDELVRGVAILRELTPRSLDAFYAYGELLSSRLVASALREAGVSASWIDTRDFMVTDGHFNAALPLMDTVTEQLTRVVRPVVEEGNVPVTQGFIGVTSSGHRTTMGRESSDYSASIIGAALGAEEVQIWTDVDGILTADPVVVRSPKKVRTLSFHEAYELSYFGAKVLHPNTMLPALERNIPIRIYNSRRPHLSGTLVTADHRRKRSIVKSIALKRNIARLTISPLRRHGQYIFWEHVYSILNRYGVQSHLTVTSEYQLAIALDSDERIDQIVHDLVQIARVEVVRGHGIVCVVGENLRTAPDVIERMFSSLSGFPVTMIGYGASNASVSILLPDDVLPDAVRRMHEEFFATTDEDVFEILDHYETAQ